MMRKSIKICTALALLGLSACSPKMAMDEGARSAPILEEPAAVVLAEPAPLERTGSCTTIDMDDGIGGTGCPAPID